MVATYNPSDREVETGNPGASELATLAVSLSGDRPCLGKHSEEQSRKTRGINLGLRQAHMRLHTQAHTHLQTKKTSSQKRVSMKMKQYLIVKLENS